MPRTRRPTIILVMAILNMVMGGITLLCGLCAAGGNALLAAMATSAPGAVGNPVQDMTTFLNKEVPGWQAVEIGRGILLILFAIVLVVSGIGLLKMQKWARWLSVSYAVVSLLFTLGYTVFELGLVLPATEKYQKQQEQLNKSVAPPPGFQAGQRVGSMVGIVIASGVSIAFAIALAIVMFLPDVAAAFAGKNQKRHRRDYGEDDYEEDDERDPEDEDWDDDYPRRRRRRRPDY